MQPKLKSGETRRRDFPIPYGKGKKPRRKNHRRK